MAVLAFASSDADPLNNPGVPAVVDLAAVTPPTTVQLYGAGEDTANPGASFTYAWSILAQGIVSGVAPASLDDPTLQNPTLTLNGWGNVLLLLVVTSNTGGASESNPRQAPKNARVVAQVLGATRGLQVMAAGERDWQASADQLIAEVENIATGVPPHAIADHTDAGAATGANLGRQIGGSYSGSGTWPGAWVPDHLHRGTDVDGASTSARGVVLLSVAPLDALNPRVVNYRLASLTGGPAHFSRVAPGPLGLVNEIRPNLVGLQPHVFWVVPFGAEIVGWWAALDSGGLRDPVNPLGFDVVEGSWSDLLSGAMGSVPGGSAALAAEGTPSVDYAPMVLGTPASPVSLGSLTAGRVVGIRCTKHKGEAQGLTCGLVLYAGL